MSRVSESVVEQAVLTWLAGVGWEIRSAVPGIGTAWSEDYEILVLSVPSLPRRLMLDPVF